MRFRLLALGFVAGTFTGVALTLLASGWNPGPSAIPAAGVLHDWQVVRDDETLLCESPSIFVVARQIQCP